MNTVFNLTSIGDEPHSRRARSTALTDTRMNAEPPDRRSLIGYPSLSIQPAPHRRPSWCKTTSE
jgi:hypothetical protein